MLVKKDVQLGSSLAGKRSESVAAESLSCGAFKYLRMHDPEWRSVECCWPYIAELRGNLVICVKYIDSYNISLGGLRLRH